MTHFTMRGVPVLTNPLLRPGLDALSTWLEDHHYSSWAASRIIARVADEGELTIAVAAGLLDPEDEPAATEIFIAALPGVPVDAPAWNAPDVFLDARLLAAGNHPVPSAPSRSIPPGAVLIPPELDDLGDALIADMHPLAIASISGGSPAADRDNEDPFADDPGMSFPHTLARMRREDPAAYREHQRRFRADVVRFFRDHPEPPSAALPVHRSLQSTPPGPVPSGPIGRLLPNRQRMQM